MHISGEGADFVADISGNNIWVEGLTVEFFGVNPENSRWYDQDTLSGFRFSGTGIDVRNNLFQFNRGHALAFESAIDVLTEGNQFLDNQNHMNYRQVRNSGVATPGRSHLSSNRVIYNRTVNTTHRDNYHEFNLEGILLAGTRSADVIENRIEKTRTIPITISDGRVANTGAVDKVGYGVTIARNTLTQSGFGIPNNEGNSETGPVWWINNCVDEFGWPGNNWNGDTITTLSGNRYGGLDNGVAMGLQLVYNNVMISNQTDPSFISYKGWSNSKSFVPGSKFFNNVWQISDPIGNSFVWGPNSGLGTLLSDTQWDFNQYWMTSGNENAFVFGFGQTLAQRQFADPLFEPNGAFSDPGAMGCLLATPIPHVSIQGVTDNPALF